MALRRVRVQLTPTHPEEVVKHSLVHQHPVLVRDVRAVVDVVEVANHLRELALHEEAAPVKLQSDWRQWAKHAVVG